MSEESDWMKDQRRHWQADHEAALKIAAHRDAPGARGEIGAQPTAPGANGPNGWPQHPVAESLYESCIATQGKIPGTVSASLGIKESDFLVLNVPDYWKQRALSGEADRDAWSARCAALMTELDKVNGQLANTERLAAMYKEAADVFHRKNAEFCHRALTAEARLAERDGPMKWLSSRNPPT